VAERNVNIVAAAPESAALHRDKALLALVKRN
jgi:hypothetical protein